MSVGDVHAVHVARQQRVWRRVEVLFDYLKGSVSRLSFCTRRRATLTSHRAPLLHRHLLPAPHHLLHTAALSIPLFPRSPPQPSRPCASSVFHPHPPDDRRCCSLHLAHSLVPSMADAAAAMSMPVSYRPPSSTLPFTHLVPLLLVLLELHACSGSISWPSHCPPSSAHQGDRGPSLYTSSHTALALSLFSSATFLQHPSTSPPTILTPFLSLHSLLALFLGPCIALLPLPSVAHVEVGD